MNARQFSTRAPATVGDPFARPVERARLAAAIGLAFSLVAPPVSAQESSSSESGDEQATLEALASGALAAGVFDRRASTALDVGLDIAGEHYALGLGGRLRWLFGDGFRTRDWDERSEWANLVRYLNFARDHGRVAVAMAMGQLGGVRLGHGAVIDGYASGLDIDHRHLGLQLRIDSQKLAGELVIDDLVAPRIIGARGRWQWGRETRALSVGGSLITDLSAPTDEAPDGAQVLPIADLEGKFQMATSDGRWLGALYGDLVAVTTMAAGAHVGLLARMRRYDAIVALRAEVRVGTDRYLPGYIGPLYELDRRPSLEPGSDPPTMDSQLDIARQGGMGGFGSLFEVRVQVPGYGDLSAYYARRAGLADQLVLRINAPYLQPVQAAAWVAAEVGAGAENWILASELRARVTGRFFAGAEVARMYRRVDGAPAPVWMASASFGATLDL